MAGGRVPGAPARGVIPMAAWLKLVEALAVGGIGEERLLELLLAGDVASRFRNPNGTTQPVPPEHWTRANVDLANSRIEATMPPWFRGPVEVDRETLLAHVGDPARAPGNTGGRPVEKNWEAAVNAVWGMIYRGDSTPRIGQRGGQADIEKLLMNWFLDQGLEVSESMARDHAKPILKELEKG